MPFPSPGDLPNPGVKPVPPALVGGFFATEQPGVPVGFLRQLQFLPFPLPILAQLVKNPPAMWETWIQSLGWEDPLEKGKATHSTILAWRTPWTL